MHQRIDTSDDRSQATIANTTPQIGTILLQADGSVVACDLVVEELLGYTAAQIVGTTLFDPIWQTIHRDGTQFQLEDYPAIASLRTGQPCRDVEMGFCKPSGELVWLHVDTTPLFQPQTPHPYGVVVTMRQSAIAPQLETSACQRVEAALSYSEQQYRALIELSPQIVFISQPDGYITYCNQWGLDFTGRSLEELQGDGWSECIHPDDRSRIYNVWMTATRDVSEYEIEIPFRRADGEYRWLYTRALPVSDETGAPAYWLGISLDITERKQAEAVLRQSEARLHAIATNLPNGAVFIVNRDLRYLLAEGKALESAGITSADLVGKTLWEALDSTVAAEYEPYYRQALGGEPFRVEHCSHDRYYVSHGTPLYNDAGEVDAVLAMSYDITERKYAELNAEVLATVSQYLVGASDVGEIVQTVGEQLNRYLNTSICAFVEINEAANEAVINYDWHQEDVPGLVGVYSLPEFVSGEFFQTAKAGLTIVVRDIATDSPIANPERFAPLKIGAFINVPLIEDNKWKFLLGVYHQAPYNWRTDQIELMRELAARIWNRIESIRAEIALRESEQKYRTLFDSIDQGFCICEMLFDENGAPSDYRHLEVNRAFEKMTGLEQATYQTARQLIPNVEDFWFETYARVVQTGEPVRFENKSIPLNRWFDVYAFPMGEPQSNQFAVLFANITARKQAEARLHSVAQADAFRVKLADALRPLTDADEIQATAARVLGEFLLASRVIYIEVVSGGEQIIVHQNYTNGVASLSGLYHLEDYGRNLINDHPAGQNAIAPDVQNSPKYPDSAKERFRAVDIAAHLDVPLIKNNQFVALLAVHQSTPRQWTEDEVKLVEETAERTWAAVERARAETALRESEARLQQAIAIETVGVIFFNNDGEIVEANDAFLRMSGYNREDIAQGLVRWDVMTPPEWMPHSLKALEELETTGRTTPYEKEYIRKDGSRWWALFAARRLNATENVEFIIDISDRKQAEAALQQSQALFEAFMRYAPVAAYIKDEQGRYLYVNPLNERTCDRPLADWLGKTDFELFPPEIAEHWRNNDLAAIAAGGAIETEESLTQLDGEHYYISYKFLILQSSSQLLGGMSLDITQRRRAEIAQRESEDMLRLATEAANLGMWHWDIPTDTLTLTDRAKTMFGLPIDTEMSIEVFLSVLHPEDSDRVVRILNQLQTTQMDVEVEYRILWADGTIRWILAKGASIHNGDGNPICTRGVLMDISSRKQAEAEREQLLLREQVLRQQAETAEAKLQEVLASIREDFVIFDRNWQIVYLNPQATGTLGMSREEILGKSFWDLFPDLVGSEFYDRLHQVMSDRIPTQFEYYYSTWDCWFENRVYPTPDGIVHLCVNISDRKRIEEELRQKNAILDVINQSAPTPIFVKDRQGRIIYANPATLKVLGKSAAEVIGYRDCDIYPNPEDAAKVMENDRRIMESGETEVVEESPDGIRTFLGMKSPYRNEAGEVIGLIGISNDISDRVQFERDRERIIQQEQAARQAAEQANRIKDEFLAVLSHELRSPLNPILGWTKLLQTGKLDAAKTAQALETIERNAKLQTELISDLLDVSRILQGKLSLNIRPVDLAVAVQAALETVSLAASAKAIDIQMQLDANVGQVSGDSSRLQQVVWNLVSNAVKFTPSGGIVTVKLNAVMGNRSWVIDNENTEPITNYQLPITNYQYAQITVSDNGKGINPEFLPYVFDYFRQEDGAITRKFGGLGLGLAIVRHLVELHGGTVEAASPGEGQGATFTVRLPLLGCQTGDNIEQQKQLVATTLSPLAGIRVLVVDDEPDMREIIAFSLEESGAEVMTAEGAAQALTALAQFKPDILLSDIGMPLIDGYMLLRRIRALSPQQGGEVKAIALTAYAAEYDQKQALQAGFQQHLAKPVEPAILVREIVNLLPNSLN